MPIYQSLHRPNMVLGAEREPAMIASLIAGLVGVGGLTLSSGLLAFAFWSICIFVLRLMAKADPLMSRIWRRHIHQQDYYSARTPIWREGGFKC